MAGNDDNHAYKPETTCPVHLWFFLCILLMFLGLSWHANYEPILESAFDNMKLLLILSPLVILLVIHWHSAFDYRRGGGGLSAFLSSGDGYRDFRSGGGGGGGGTPWGVGLLLVFVFFMISYHSTFREKWFPLFSRN
ncbi:hypothetical protein TIFTF001_033210 [Ficus carica]|uniref:Transmembrane protein n=1 Tax=Ficus carica TaxID=3494 RepID=A0AA88DXZ0_FICCA|nr:hypothetical protein TIFTF001_033210 [Ficus carica]